MIKGILPIGPYGKNQQTYELAKQHWDCFSLQSDWLESHNVYWYQQDDVTFCPQFKGWESKSTPVDKRHTI